MKRKILGTVLISSRSGWWVWHIIPNRLCISWRYYADAFEPETSENKDES